MTTIKEGTREFSITISIGKPINTINLPQEQFADKIKINGRTYLAKTEEPKALVWRICYRNQLHEGLTWQKWAAPLTGTRQEAVHHFNNVYPEKSIHNVTPCGYEYKDTSCFTSAVPYEAK